MRRHKSDRLIGVLTAILMVVGLVVIYTIGPMRTNYENAAYGLNADPNNYFWHQLISVVLAVGVFILAFKVPYGWIRRSAKIVLILGLLACALLAILATTNSSLASCQNGACRWFNLGVVSFQPAELLKLGMVMYLADLIAERKKQGKFERSSDFWLPFAIMSIISLVFVVIVQSDMGTGVALVAIILAILWMSNIKQQYFWLVVAIIAIAGVFAILMAPHRMERLMTFSGSGSEDDNYHIDNALMAIGSGGFFGVGIGNSVQATGYLPESINDSVFAVMGETFGFLGLALILICFTILLFRMMRTATHLRDDDQRLMVAGFWAWIMAHMVTNIASMTGLIPLTGVTLPLLSYGGTSMLFMAFALGLTLQLSCYTSREEEKDESISSGRRLRGSYHSSRRRSA